MHSAKVIELLPKGRLFALEARTGIKLFPKGMGDRSWVYAIGFSGGVTKIGQTTRPRQRFAQHCARVGGEIKWVRLFTSGSVTYAYHVEQRAIRFAKECSERVNTTEYFKGLTKDDAIRCIHQAEIEQRAATTAAKERLARDARIHAASILIDRQMAAEREAAQA